MQKKEILKQYFVSNICIKLFAFKIESKLFCMPYYGMRFACYGMRFVSYGMKFKCFAIVHVVKYTLKLIVALCIYPTFRCFTRSYFLLGLRHGVVVSTAVIHRNSSKKARFKQAYNVILSCRINKIHDSSLKI